MFERSLELELAPLELREAMELTLLFAGLCVVSGGGVLLFGGVWSHVRGETPWIGLWLVLGGGTLYGLMCWLLQLQPHKAAEHAAHRLRHHSSRLRRQSVQAASAMTEAQFDALEDAVDGAAADSQT